MLVVVYVESMSNYVGPRPLHVDFMSNDGGSHPATVELMSNLGRMSNLSNLCRNTTAFN